MLSNCYLLGQINFDRYIKKVSYECLVLHLDWREWTNTSARAYSAPSRAELLLTSDEETPMTEINLTSAL